MTKVGAYALIRFFTLIFHHHENVTHPLLIFMSCLTMIIGAFGVLAYKDIKKSLPTKLFYQLDLSFLV